MNTVADAERTTDALADLPGVASATVRRDDPRYNTNHTIEAILPAGYDRVPPRVLRCFAEHDYGLADVSPQGARLVLAAI